MHRESLSWRDENPGRFDLSASSINGWQDVHAEVLRRLQSRRWKPGDLLPSEADMATEFGCARTTVNRAMQAIADEGLIERRRRGGTRVVVHPTRKATFDIPVIRLEIEQRGFVYGYRLVERRRERAPAEVRAHMLLETGVRLLHVRAVHLAGEQPFVLEDRWIDTRIVPAAGEADFEQLSPNQWLVENVPFSGGDLAISASVATDDEAELLALEAGVPLINIERRTRNTELAVITSVRLSYGPGYRMQVEL